MTVVTFQCSTCGKRVRKVVEEELPPVFLRCVCGAKFPLTVERENARGLPAANTDQEVDWPEELWVDARLLEVF